MDTFEFVSSGRHGLIPKKIIFLPTTFSNVYALVFGDINDDNEINDYAVSNNGDRNKILATIVNVIDIYTEKYPERWIYFKGNTKVRTRLYRMVTGLNLEKLSEEFEIFADTDTGVVPFQKNMHVNAFVVKRKIYNFDV